MTETTPFPDLPRLLRGVALFAGLLDEDLAWFASRAERLDLGPGAALFAKGEPAERIYVLESGGAAIFRAEAGGSEREVARYVAGDALGDFEFAAGTPHSGGARTITAARLVAFPRRGLAMPELSRENPGAAARLLLRAACMVSARLRSTQALISHNAPWVRELRGQIYTDPGTGLWSRAWLDEEIPRLIERPTSLVMVKPDRFKELNDAHGHGAGDAAMERFAAILRDQVGRFGRGWALRLRSNEMALVLPRCAPAEAAEAARLVAAQAQAIDLSRSVPDCSFRFTSSFALASWPEDGDSWRGLVDSSWNLLTKAWKDGGNRIYRLKARECES